MRLFILLLLMLAAAPSFAQYQIRELSDDDPEHESSGLIGKNEILLANMLYKNYKIKYSVDKKSWPEKILKPDSVIEIKLNDEYAYFFVKVCNTHDDTVDCVHYRLKPGSRYALKISGESSDIVIKSGK